MEQNNAARRLHKILKLAMTNGKGDKPIFYALAMALDIKSPDENIHLFTEFFTLLNDVEYIVTQLKRVSDLDEHITAVKEVKSIFLKYGLCQGLWESAKVELEQKGLIRSLSACATFIDHEQIYPSLGEEQLEAYLQECESLLQEVMSSDLPETIKTYLVTRLEEICLAIRHYSIGGPERLRIVVEANIGGILLRSAGISQEEKEKPIFTKVFGWLMTLGGVLDLAANTQGYLLPKVAEIAKYLLPPGQ
jgi:hypothetical protein